MNYGEKLIQMAFLKFQHFVNVKKSSQLEI